MEKASLSFAYLASHKKAREAIRQNSKAVSPKLTAAFEMAFSAVISYQQRIQGKKYPVEEASIPGRMFLIAQFIQGIDITETAISEGLYAQAGNLLKQELETITAIAEFEDGRRRDGATPNVQNRFALLRRKYGQLNNIAHPSKAKFVEKLSAFIDGDSYGPTTIVQFDASFYNWLRRNQIMFIIVLFSLMRSLFLEVFNLDQDEQETGLIASAIDILTEARMSEMQTAE